MQLRGMCKVIIGTIAITLTVGVSSIKSERILADTDTITFSDVNGHWANATIMWAADLGIVKGTGDGTFGPNRNVTEAEFVTMLFNSFPEMKIPIVPSRPWYTKYYTYALTTMNWPVSLAAASKPVLRGQVASIVAASQGQLLSMDKAVQYLLDHKLANGKTAATVAGFGKEAPLTRAEAVSFMKNLLDQGVTLSAAKGVVEEDKLKRNETVRDDAEFSIRGIAIGDSEADLVKNLGQPIRKDLSEYGFQWYIYNKDYKNYAQIGVLQGKVVGLYGNTTKWQSKHGIKVGSTAVEVKKQYGASLTEIQKGNTIYSIMREAGEKDIFLLDDAYTTIFYDIHVNYTVTAVQQIAKEVELSLRGFAGKPSKELSQSFERQDFDLVNAVRVRMGHTAFIWADDAAASARKHSVDMGSNGYFAHENLAGKSPFDRMKAEGITYSSAGENIAYGQQSAIFAHEGWMNSEGHRKNILTDFKRLGVGVGLSEKDRVYYTENFYTP
ncbi:copper amine oxidase [Paenibacillus psychroresistens]|uniref:Copper amine oxidase n=1 Tax=Paenibacillus psychroresistens TaxID=1778678 RepID=A0A6B8RRL8_9BACL|nr:CAP-associated domain-containing protein [Paenibacillus psychroresistens]QGQ98454.1 copper amine oxidase [Paenibacillus psychroresistens]